MGTTAIRATVRAAAALAAALLAASCAGGPESAPSPPPPPAAAAAEKPAEAAPQPEQAPPEAPPAASAVRFVPRDSPLALPEIPAAIGSWASDAPLSASRKAALTAAFRDAYREALVRGVGLAGALGGDLAHAWKPPARRSAGPVPESRGAVAQNWRDPRAGAGSWGLDSLVLACAPLDGDRVFVVAGPLLDAYGKGNGVGGANGVAGYGAPLGDEHSYGGGRAQRFEFGLILLNADLGSATFSRGEAPSAAGIPDSVGEAGPDAGTGEGRFGAAERSAFRSAWAAAVNSGRQPAAADGPVETLSGGGRRVWVQSFGASAWWIALSAGRPAIADGIFLDAFRGGFGGYGPPIAGSFRRGDALVLELERGRLEAPAGK